MPLCRDFVNNGKISAQKQKPIAKLENKTIFGGHGKKIGTTGYVGLERTIERKIEEVARSLQTHATVAH